MPQFPPADPVFVYGALRSGTTLLHLILNSHSGLSSPGEADFLFDHIRPDPSGPGGWMYDREALAADRIFKAAKIDLPEGQGLDLAHAIITTLSAKAPGQILSLNIHRNAHLMHAVFPASRIIHLVRDPRDVARSAVQMGWQGHSYFAVDLWVKTETTWDRAAIPENQVLTVKFEELMGDLQTGLTRICDFLGLVFEPTMLDYHMRSSYDRPDPKIAQKWRQKATPREIALIEGRAGHLMVPRGYALAGDPATPGSVEKFLLSTASKWNRWRFNIRRYGMGLFLKHHLARLLGLRGVAARLAAEQEAIRVQNLK